MLQGPIPRIVFCQNLCDDVDDVDDVDNVDDDDDDDDDDGSWWYTGTGVHQMEGSNVLTQFLTSRPLST